MREGAKRINLIVKEPSVSAKKLIAVMVLFGLLFGAGFRLQTLPETIVMDTDPNLIQSSIPQLDSNPKPETAFLKELSSRILSIPGVKKLEAAGASETLAVEFRSDEFFKIGTATLEERSTAAIRQVAFLLKEAFAGSWVEIEGHTDDSPVIKQRKIFPSNWELSAARAASLLHVFEEAGFQKNQLKVAGYGDSRPVGESQSLNRRIVVRVTRMNEEGGR